MPDDLLPEFWTGMPERRAADFAGPDREADRFAIEYSDPGFGYKYAKIMARHRIPFPGHLDGADNIVFKAYLVHSNPRVYKDAVVSRAVELNSPMAAGIAGKLQALLLAKNADIQTIAGKMGLSEPLVRAYEALFYNVVDRKGDAYYTSRLAYPRGRVDEYMKNYLESVDFGDLLKRAGYSHGVDDVVYLSGLRGNIYDSISEVDSGKQLENLLMAHGVILARNGWVNHMDGAAINHAKQLLTAGKLGGSETGAGGSDFADMGQMMWDEYSVMQRSRMADVLSLRTANAVTVPDLVVEQA